MERIETVVLLSLCKEPCYKVETGNGVYFFGSWKCGTTRTWATCILCALGICRMFRMGFTIHHYHFLLFLVSI